MTNYNTYDNFILNSTDISDSGVTPGDIPKLDQETSLNNDILLKYSSILCIHFPYSIES